MWFLLKIYFLVGQQIGDLGTPTTWYRISFPPLSLNMNSLKQILEDGKIEGGSEKRENCLLTVAIDELLCLENAGSQISMFFTSNE